MSPHERPPPPPEPEGVRTRLLLLIGAAALALFTLAVAAQALLLREWEGEPRPTVPREVGQPEIGRVNQEPFTLETRAARIRREQQRQLESYGWTDRDAGLIHVPVEEAKRRLLAEEGAEGGR
ncbi:hypothetical protein P2318_34500 [Myxococcaceae bacterium GXIMD 01537]